MDGTWQVDVFVEQIVVKKKDGKDIAIFAGVFLAMIVVIFLCLTFLVYIQMFAFLIVIGAGYGGWRIITSRNLEFEYSVTNGEIDIDKIIAQRKRKRIVSVAGRRLETLEPYVHEEYANRKFDRTVMAASSMHEEGLWCFTYRSKSGHTLVVFQPETRVIDALLVGLQPLVYRETKKYFDEAVEIEEQYLAELKKERDTARLARQQEEDAKKQDSDKKE